MANCGKRCKRQWSDLPTELVSQIAERLGLIELLGFRSACKAWKSASSTASAHTQSSLRPWLLLYGENCDQCQLLNVDSGNKFTISLPELDASTTCLSSNQGWLLLFQQGGSMFFFNSFSRVNIDLPKFPVSDLSDHVAAFSCPPTSQDCIVSVISRVKKLDLELKVLHRRANEWTKHKHCCPSIKAIKFAAYHDGEFYFFDCGDSLLSFSTKNLGWALFGIVKSGSGQEFEDLPFGIVKTVILNKFDKLKLQLGLPAKNVSISTCGTQFQLGSKDKAIFNESIKLNADEESKSRHFKGVWIHPRFCQISPNYQSW